MKLRLIGKLAGSFNQICAKIIPGYRIPGIGVGDLINWTYVGIIYRLWDEAALEIDPDLCSLTIVDVIHSQDVVRQSAALALAALLEEYRKEIEGTLSKLFSLHQDKLLVSLTRFLGWDIFHLFCLNQAFDLSVFFLTVPYCLYRFTWCPQLLSPCMHVTRDNRFGGQ